MCAHLHQRQQDNLLDFTLARAEFAREAALVADHNARARDIIELSVGGQAMVTTRSTLTKVDGSMLAAMFSGRHQLERDSAGKVFIDRDPKYFAFVLDYLRNGGKLPANMPADEAEQQRVREEFDYFALPASLSPTATLVQMVARGAYKEIDISAKLGVEPATSVHTLDLSDRFIAVSLPTSGNRTAWLVHVWDRDNDTPFAIQHTIAAKDINFMRLDRNVLALADSSRRVIKIYDMVDD